MGLGGWGAGCREVDFRVTAPLFPIQTRHLAGATPGDIWALTPGLLHTAAEVSLCLPRGSTLLVRWGLVVVLTAVGYGREEAGRWRACLEAVVGEEEVGAVTEKLPPVSLSVWWSGGRRRD